jgi:hypothetical protein
VATGVGVIAIYGTTVLAVALLLLVSLLLLAT